MIVFTEDHWTLSSKTSQGSQAEPITNCLCTIAHFTCKCKGTDPVFHNLLLVKRPTLPSQLSSTSGMQEHMTKTLSPLDFCPSVYLLLARYNRGFCFPVRMHFLLLCTDAEETCSCILSALFRMLSELHVAYNIFWPLQWLHGWIPFREQNNWKS